jgi:hypothetical protein
MEIAVLRRARLNHNDLRWLVCVGLLEHAREIIKTADIHRRFRPCRNLSFDKRSCFVLTPTGAAALARQPAINGAATWLSAGQLATNSVGIRRSRPSGAICPHWDSECHEFRIGDEVVKAFKLPSPNQETILAAFEEEGWPQRIDDPLTPSPSIHPKRRLHDTIKSLNRNQRIRRIRFMGDGTGEGIRWTLIESGL